MSGNYTVEKSLKDFQITNKHATKKESTSEYHTQRAPKDGPQQNQSCKRIAPSPPSPTHRKRRNQKQWEEVEKEKNNGPTTFSLPHHRRKINAWKWIIMTKMWFIFKLKRQQNNRICRKCHGAVEKGDKSYFKTTEGENKAISCLFSVRFSPLSVSVI